jgi:hypothetical protein
MLQRLTEITVGIKERVVISVSLQQNLSEVTPVILYETVLILILIVIMTASVV